MMKKTTFRAVVLTSSMILGTTIASAADTTFESAAVKPPAGAPTSHKGFETLKKQVVDLGPEIPGMEGRELRLRVMKIEPGGNIKVHGHKNRPAVFYVIQGETTITYGDGTVKSFPTGSMGFANKDTVHWHQNNGKEPVVFVAGDIFQPKKK